MTGAEVGVDDAYRELGLGPEASDAQVKAAWRRMAARWHPDRNASPQALRKIQRINRALEEIRLAREGADTTGSEAPPPPSPDPPTASTWGHEEPEPERTAEHTVQLTLEQALAGSATELKGEIVETCRGCQGSGLELLPSTCGTCGGEGRVKQGLWFSWVASNATCTACEGRGRVRASCGGCQGSGNLPARSYRCRVRIPPGVRDGDVVHATARLAGRGGGSLGLRVRIALQPHPFFSLQEDGTVTCEVPVDGFAWVANRWVEIPTPGGLQQMRLRRGALVYRVKGQGFPVPDGEGRADCMVTVVPLFPDTLHVEHEAAIERLIAANTRSPSTPAGKRMAAWDKQVKGWEAEMKRERERERAGT